MSATKDQLANAYDPSTWGDEEHDRAEARYEPGGDLGPEPEPVDREALDAELADLRELERSTQAQLDKAQVTVESAKTELSRLQFRINAVEQDIESFGVADTEDEG